MEVASGGSLDQCLTGILRILFCFYFFLKISSDIDKLSRAADLMLGIPNMHDSCREDAALISESALNQ